MVIRCNICGVTNETSNGWIRCRKTGEYTCTGCCMKCEHYVSWSGLWKCTYKTEEMLEEERQREKERRAAIRKQKEEEELMEISRAYFKRRLAERAKRQARARRSK